MQNHLINDNFSLQIECFEKIENVRMKNVNLNPFSYSNYDGHLVYFEKNYRQIIGGER